MEEPVQMRGRMVVEGTLVAKTGLHIGSGEKGIKIGGADKTVVRNPLDERPYIPGSSLKGKMRSLLEKAGKDMKLKNIGTQKHPIRLHLCDDAAKVCEICTVFGLPGQSAGTTPTRLILRDARLTDDSAKRLKQAKDEGKTEFLYTEIKSENAIDRITSAANPREFERVPAGAEFGFEALYTVFEEGDMELFNLVIKGMRLLEDDSIGGHGSRGYGKVEFRDLKVYWNTPTDYEKGTMRTRPIIEAKTISGLKMDELKEKMKGA